MIEHDKNTRKTMTPGRYPPQEGDPGWDYDLEASLSPEYKALRAARKMDLYYADIVVNPDLPESVRDRIRGSGLEALPTEGEARRTPWAKLALACAFPFFAHQAGGFYATMPGRFILGGQTIFMVCYLYKPSSKGYRRKVRKVRNAHLEDFVIPADLNTKAKRLLDRTQAARKTVLASTVHTEGRLDKQHNETAFPTHEWQIAKALLAYTKAEKEIPSEAATTRQLAKAVDIRRKALEKGIAGVIRRIEGLELYAQKVVKLDRQEVEIRKALALSTNDTHLMDLLAHSAADDMALAEIQGLTEQARILSERFAVALEEAKDAAVLVLPIGKTA